ncbi:hypothetical protein HCBG_03302 [Histoplasma capsulatum G186AR]|uniref:Uncharacterized protein n=1 Tax=Ajellomyces capsulatus (strain G186AR / H82 / ATCC MYA-2454 / RMSCC 2432) TaxID=447093 RepID=C0NJH2_AJECG|nr:uncharacterized protein HCBG_03302 [Histoplasma capsulatum G186AR]EEH08013.1 hypothetical protein HCBG_03302 [Histoplasma capsulatum G186AR]
MKLFVAIVFDLMISAIASRISVSEAMKGLEHDPNGLVDIGDDGILRSFDSRGTVIDYRRLTTDELHSLSKDFVKGNDERLLAMWANVDSSLVDEEQIWNPRQDYIKQFVSEAATGRLKSRAKRDSLLSPREPHCTDFTCWSHSDCAGPYVIVGFVQITVHLQGRLREAQCAPSSQSASSNFTTKNPPTSLTGEVARVNHQSAYTAESNPEASMEASDLSLAMATNTTADKTQRPHYPMLKVPIRRNQIQTRSTLLKPTQSQVISLPFSGTIPGRQKNFLWRPSRMQWKASGNNGDTASNMNAKSSLHPTHNHFC